eukprot:9492867-Pyramimonas_sp.AAC.1
MALSICVGHMPSPILEGGAREGWVEGHLLAGTWYWWTVCGVRMPCDSGGRGSQSRRKEEKS